MDRARSTEHTDEDYDRLVAENQNLQIQVTREKERSERAFQDAEIVEAQKASLDQERPIDGVDQTEALFADGASSRNEIIFEATGSVRFVGLLNDINTSSRRTQLPSMSLR